MATTARSALGPSGVSILFRPCRPSAVAGLVVPVIVDPLDGVARGTRAHVGSEARDIVEPPIAHRDPSTAVVLEVLAAGVQAPVLHVRPAAPNVRMAEPVQPSSVAQEFRLEAAAALGEPSLDVLPDDGAYLTAGATTDHQPLAPCGVRGFRNDGPEVALLPRQGSSGPHVKDGTR